MALWRLLMLALLSLQLLALAIFRPVPLISWLWIQKYSVQTAPSYPCDSGMIYLYPLHPRFNSELVLHCENINPWRSICPAFENFGLGPSILAQNEQKSWLNALIQNLGSILKKNYKPESWLFSGSWSETDQFLGEVIFHAKLHNHACVTSDPEVAKAFYVPFYAGLDIARYLFINSTVKERDMLGSELVNWLKDQKYWQRNGGLDHFIMLGRITWDFRRGRDLEWGSSLLNMPEMKNLTRLVIEKNPWDSQDVGVPYPTGFHPRNEQELADWQEFVQKRERKYLFSFVGAPRRSIKNDFREILRQQCQESSSCKSWDCSFGRCNGPKEVMEIFLDSVFCLQPRGDSFTRRSIFDAMVAGCIPVFFWNQSAYWQYQWFFPRDQSSYSIFIHNQEIRKGLKIKEVLEGVSEQRILSMQKIVVNLIPKLIYSAPNAGFEDAFSIATEGVLQRINNLLPLSRL